MKSIRIVFILSLLNICSTELKSQSDYKACYGFDCKQKKWSISLFGGLSAFGPGPKIKRQMNASGLGDPGIVYDGSGNFKMREYPYADPSTSWHIAIGYDISKKSGIQFTTGNNYHATVVGHDNIGNGNDMGIESNIWTTSINYVWRLRKGKDGLSIGPVIASYTSTADNRLVFEKIASISSTVKFGFNIGYTFSLIQTKSWFLAANLNSTWLPNAVIGHYTVSHNREFSDPLITYSSTFPKTTIPLSHISFGFSSGFKF